MITYNASGASYALFPYLSHHVLDTSHALHLNSLVRAHMRKGDTYWGASLVRVFSLLPSLESDRSLAPQ